MNTNYYNKGVRIMKMKLIDNLNRGMKRFNYEITDNHEYAKLGDLYNTDSDKVYIVRMFYTNKKSQFGDNEVVVTDDYLINLPQHLTETVKEIINSDEYRELINQGKLVFNIYEYEYKQGKQTKKAYSVNWGIL